MLRSKDCRPKSTDMDIKKYIAEGKLELYVLDLLPADERRDVDRLLAMHEELGEEMERLLIALENYASSVAVEPSPHARRSLDDILKFPQQSITEGYLTPPLLEQCFELEPWLCFSQPFLDHMDRNRLTNYSLINYSDTFIQLFFNSDQAFDWPAQTGRRESYLVLSGEAELRVNGRTEKLSAGDYFTKPIDRPHHLKVSSPMISLILQWQT